MRVVEDSKPVNDQAWDRTRGTPFFDDTGEPTRLGLETLTHRLDEKLDTVTHFVMMQWQVLSESLEWRPMRTEELLEALGTNGGERPQPWKVDAAVFVPS